MNCVILKKYYLCDVKKKKKLWGAKRWCGMLKKEKLFVGGLKNKHLWDVKVGQTFMGC